MRADNHRLGFIDLTESARYYPKSAEPLSAEVFLIEADGGEIIFDVGASEGALEAVKALPGEKTVVLSHFHADHAANIAKLRPSRLLAGSYTYKKYGGELVAEDISVFGARVFPLPSSHAKGCLGLMYGGLAFLGDGVYACAKGYNAGTLRETVEKLKSLEKLGAERFVLSHSEPLLLPSRRVIEDLEAIYAGRKSGEAYISV